MKGNKVSRKGLKLNFYSKEEIAQLTDAIKSGEYKNDSKLAIVYSEKLNRSYATTYAKIRQLNGKKPIRKVIEPKRIPAAKIVVEKVEQVAQEVKPLTLPKGMTYQGTAKKVELHADHFRVYF
jgi:hypothetical protein